MSPLLITGLILIGLFLLIAIGYLNHVVENNKLKKARLRADLNDRIRRCATVSQNLPGQFMGHDLKFVLTRLELQLCERLKPLDRNNADLHSRTEALRAEADKGQAMAVNNPPQQIASEAQAKEAHFLLEELHVQITRAAKDGLLPASEAKHWFQQIQGMLTALHIEYFTNLGKLALQQGQPRQARLAFERGVKYIRQQADATAYQAQLRLLQSQLEHTNALVLEHGLPSDNEPNELTEGLKALDDEDQWKKKSVYDN